MGIVKESERAGPGWGREAESARQAGRPVAGETIFALSSGRGRAAIAVIRISGALAGEALQWLSGRRLPEARRACYGRLRDPSTGAPLDDGVLLWFPGPGSETGEDVAELQIHGGRATVSAVLDSLAKLPGLRLARPGEFTRRAFENGKLDLTAVEGLADLVNAETEAQRRQALRQLRGELGRLYQAWRERLIRVLAHAEALIDFPEETGEGIPDDRLSYEISDIGREISQHLDDNRRGELLREGLSIAILGPPNVGKSSLLNALVRRDAAIVSEQAGTTRDVIEVHLDLVGFPVILADTAGIRESDDAIEREGVRRARDRAAMADVQLLMLDATEWPKIQPEMRALITDMSLLVLNKIDLAPPRGHLYLDRHRVLQISVSTGVGLEELLGELGSIAVKRLSATEAPSLTRLRHRDALLRCVEALNRVGAASSAELAIEDLRLAMRELGRITGFVDVEDLLDVIFRDFCIGK